MYEIPTGCDKTNRQSAENTRDIDFKQRETSTGVRGIPLEHAENGRRLTPKGIDIPKMVDF
jgi:hypothetical protein